jgi:hypothetical protein
MPKVMVVDDEDAFSLDDLEALVMKYAEGSR